MKEMSTGTWDHKEKDQSMNEVPVPLQCCGVDPALPLQCCGVESFMVCTGSGFSRFRKIFYYAISFKKSIFSLNLGGLHKHMVVNPKKLVEKLEKLW